ncbi:MAG: DUF1996 domain-containing protein [Oxalobacteraceae bacterium]|nr:MAG: DUF1996 domain-containing protein [Oxalobacteraceae bacterium]
MRPLPVLALALAPMLLLLATSATTRTAARCALDHSFCDNEEQAGRAAQVSVPSPPNPASLPVPSRRQAPWVDCAVEGKTCRGSGWGEVRYGTADRWRRVMVKGDAACGNDLFGDPAPAVVKRCERRSADAPPMPASVVAIASDFDPSALIGQGYHPIVASNRPDVVGAFRIICTAGQLNYDDPILYPSTRGGSPHLHQWYGNTAAGYASTYASLRRSGRSTCSNELNRSAYWVPALMNATGKVIQPDYISLYYKRLPDSDPQCFKEATKGCTGLPTGLRVVSGYDMVRMGEKQPENATFHFRCISPGKPSEHRPLIAEAIADCGGSGQVMAMIGFGNCWTGTLDSADHRSHLVFGDYIGQAYPQCPASHPYKIPELTQGVVYTIQPSDGIVWFASDRMNGMTVPGGASFHADYMEGWDPKARATWERQCIGKLLNCSDGELGDGTMLKRGNLTYLAATRLVEVPVR